MDSDSDAPLSSLASMDYLRREIAKFERFIAEKTARVPPSAASQATAGRRLLPRTPTACIADSPIAVTPSSLQNGGGDSVAPRTDAQVRSSGRSNATARSLERSGSNRGRESDEPLRGRERVGPQSYEYRGGEIGGSPRSARKTKPGGEPSSCGHSEGSSEELAIERKSSRKTGRPSTGVKLGSYDGNTCLQTFLTWFEN